MPFFEERRQIADLTNFAPPDSPDLDPSMRDTWGAAFRTQNVVGSYITMKGAADPYKIEEGFDAIDYVKDDAEFSPYVEEFSGIFNKQAAEAKKAQIRQEVQDRRILDSAGASGIIAQLAAGVVDLPTLLPIGGPLMSGAKGMSMAASIAIASGVDAAVSEAGLQATQATRTGAETALNIGGSIVLGGALGALAGRYLSSTAITGLSAKIERQAAEFDDIDKGFAQAQSAGAAAADRGPLTLKDEGLFKALKGLNQQDPMIRLQLSDLDEGRQVVRQMAETPLEYADNAAGVATERGGAVETRMKLWQAPLARASREIDTYFARYYQGGPETTWTQRAFSPAQSEWARLRGGQKLTFKEFKEEVGRAAYMGGKHDLPEVAAAAKVYRDLDDALKQAAIEARIPGFTDDMQVAGDISHRFRMYNKPMIIAERGRFADILLEDFRLTRDMAAKAEKDAGKAADKADAAARKADDFGRLTDAELRSIVDDTIDTILGNADGRIPYDIVAGPRGPLKERVLKIATAKIHDFVENDIEQVMRAQIRTMSADIELSKKFGSVDLAEQIRKVNDEANARIAKAGTAKERQRLDKARKDAVRDIEGIRDRLRGTYRLPSDPSSLVLRAGRIVRNLNYVRLLGGMTISAIPDMGKVVFAHGLTSTFRDGFLPLVTNFRAFRLAAEEVKSSGTALDMVSDSRTMAMADITDDFGHNSKFERGLSAVASKFGVVSLMAPWNASAKQFTGMITMTSMLRATKRVADGKASAEDIRKLAASGIDADLAGRIAKQFAEHGDTQGGVLLARGSEWTDKGALEAFRTAVVREVDKTVVTPGQDKPLWMSTELGKIIGQFKSFGVSSVQKTLFAGMQQRDAAVLNGAMIMLALGALTYKIKTEAAGRETSDDATVWAVEAFDRSGLAGWLMEINNASEKITRGKVGLSALTGEQVSRYASRNAVASILGPSLGTVQDILDVTGGAMAGEFGDVEKRKLQQLIPAQNLFYVRMLLNQVEKGN